MLVRNIISSFSFAMNTLRISIVRRTMATLQRNWDLCVSAVEVEQRPIYFCSENVATQRQQGTLLENFPWKRSLALTAYNPGDRSQSSVKNAIVYDELGKELKASIPNGASVLSSFAFFPDNPAFFERGFFVTASENVAVTEDFIKKLAKKYEQAGYFRYEVRGDRVYQILVSVHDGKLQSESPLIQIAPPLSHPVLSHPSHHSVFHDFSKVQEVLSDCNKSLKLAGIKELWNTASSFLDEGRLPPLKADNYVIIIEGLDATGKTTLCKRLFESIPSSLLVTPPNCISHLRPIFDDYPPLVRRAYYSLGNYLAAQEIVEAARKGPVILDRFWHSSAAYAIAAEVGCGGSDCLPPPGSEVYKWPHDLIKPDLVILLVTSPEERQRRMDGRGKEKTTDEIQLEKSLKFQERLLESYKRMSEPELQIVDASGTPEEVQEAVLKLLERKLRL